MEYVVKNIGQSPICQQRGAINLVIVIILLAAIIGGFALFTSQKKATDSEFNNNLALQTLTNIRIVTIVGGNSTYIESANRQAELQNAVSRFSTQTGVPARIVAFEVSSLGFLPPKGSYSTMGGDPEVVPPNSECVVKLSSLLSDPNSTLLNQIQSGSESKQLLCIECANQECTSTIISAPIADGFSGGQVPVPTFTASPTPTVTPIGNPPPTPTDVPPPYCPCDGNLTGDPCTDCICQVLNNCPGNPGICGPGYCPNGCGFEICPQLN